MYGKLHEKFLRYINNCLFTVEWNSYIALCLIHFASSALLGINTSKVILFCLFKKYSILLALDKIYFYTVFNLKCNNIFIESSIERSNKWTNLIKTRSNLPWVSPTKTQYHSKPKKNGGGGIKNQH